MVQLPLVAHPDSFFSSATSVSSRFSSPQPIQRQQANAVEKLRLPPCANVALRRQGARGPMYVGRVRVRQHPSLRPALRASSTSSRAGRCRGLGESSSFAAAALSRSFADQLSESALFSLDPAFMCTLLFISAGNAVPAPAHGFIHPLSTRPRNPRDKARCLIGLFCRMPWIQLAPISMVSP